MNQPVFWAPLIAVTAALTWMTWDLRRARHRQRRYDKHTTESLALTRPLRCLVCPGQPEVSDYRTHSRLWHHPARVVGPEDQGGWTR